MDSHIWKKILKFLVSTVSADGLASQDAWASAGTVMINFGSFIFMLPAHEGLKFPFWLIHFLFAGTSDVWSWHDVHKNIQYLMELETYTVHVIYTILPSGHVFLNASIINKYMLTYSSMNSIFKYVFMLKNHCLWVQIPLKYLASCPIENKSLVPVMAWCHQTAATLLIYQNHFNSLTPRKCPLSPKRPINLISLSFP